MCNVCVFKCFRGLSASAQLPKSLPLLRLILIGERQHSLHLPLPHGQHLMGGFPALNPLIGTDTLIVLFIILMFYGL